VLAPCAVDKVADVVPGIRERSAEAGGDLTGPRERLVRVRSTKHLGGRELCCVGRSGEVLHREDRRDAATVRCSSSVHHDIDRLAHERVGIGDSGRFDVSYESEAVDSTI
jgi:hypothetical protein